MRGQIWTIDLSTSVVIFVVTVVIVLLSFNLVIADTFERVELTKMQDLALEVTESFVRTTGSPRDWNPSDVSVIGFAQEHSETQTSTGVKENVLDGGKVFDFVSAVDYEQSKMLMGISSYQYHFRVENIDGSDFIYQGLPLVKGMDYASAANIVPVERYVLLNSTIARLVFTLWN